MNVLKKLEAFDKRTNASLKLIIECYRIVTLKYKVGNYLPFSTGRRPLLRDTFHSAHCVTHPKNKICVIKNCNISDMSNKSIFFTIS